MNVKSDSILVRVAEADKARIKGAALQAGKSLSSFVLNAAVKEAGKIEKNPPARGVHRGVPSYFKGWCFTASQGGEFGYEGVGYQLVRTIGGEQPYDLEDEEWAVEVDELGELLSVDDDTGALGWFERHYPNMMKLIPARRREQFMIGVNRAYEEEGLEI